MALYSQRGGGQAAGKTEISESEHSRLYTLIQSCTKKHIILFTLYWELIDLNLINQLKPNGEGSSELALNSYTKSSFRAFA